MKLVKRLLILGIFLQLILFKFSAVNSFAASSAFQFKNACQKGIYIEVSLRAANSADVVEDSKPLVVDFRKGKRTLASDCESWAAKTLPHFERMLFENQNSNRDARDSMVCHHTAEVQYQVGSAAKKSVSLCIGDSSKDAVSYGFRKFYEGSVKGEF